MLLSLGSEFELPENMWKSLSARLEEILKHQTSLFAAEEAVEKWAQKISKALLKKSPSLAKGDENGPVGRFESVDIDSLEYRDVRTIGAEHVALETIRNLGLETYLGTLDFNRVEQVAAIGTLVARMVHPGSDRETARWLHETSGLGELLDFDIARISLDKIYDVSDKILKHKTQLEEFLYKQEADLFKLKGAIVLYDLSNTYLEGSGKYNDKAAHGRSKEKRKDCKLVTLALSLDEDGFPRQSQILKGNISEPQINGINKAIEKNYVPTQEITKYAIRNFIQSVRSLPSDPVVARSNLESSYHFLTPRGASILNGLFTKDNPVSEFGKKTRSLHVDTVLPISENTYQAEWRLSLAFKS